MIIAVNLCHDPHRKIFDCNNCDDESKVQRGCKEDTGEVVAEFSCVCGGNESCVICNGREKFEVLQCPGKILGERLAYRFLPYFFAWKAGNYQQYPDGKPRLEQPIKMLEAFSIANEICVEREIASIKKSVNKNVK